MRERGSVEIDARGLAVAPGFINMLSWATTSLIADGRSQSDIRQGVTLEVMGEGYSMGPLTGAMKVELVADSLIEYDVEWTTLGEFLEYLARNAGRVVSRAEISTHVWDDNHDPMSNLIEVYVSRLRRKVDGGEETPLVHTRRGAGYMLTAEASA